MNIHVLRTIIINAISLSVALGLWRNRRSNPDITVKEWPPGCEAPYVEIIIPARNEERNLPPLLHTLTKQKYPPGRWGITVVDDGSNDATAAVAGQFATLTDQAGQQCRVSVLQAPPLPKGWTGKAHAMWFGSQAAPSRAEWLLFVDADTRHSPEMLASVIL